VTGVPTRLGVVGAGTMGAGIAQLGCLAGMDTVLHDPVPDALASAAERVAAGLERGAERGRWSADDARAARARLATADALDGLASCELVIEAAPERLELKRELFGRLSELCGPGVVLATNTSSIPVGALGSAAARPEDVVGMHFFNPPALMELLEVVAADDTGERALAVARAAGEAMGRRVIVARDGPGFLVNRCGRPFGGEALRLLQERVATVEQIDRVCRLGGGFRMGPFELMDLVGIDVGLEVARSFHSQSFGEPRWRPSPLQERLVASGRLGRKSGRGWYRYEDGGHRDAVPDPPPQGGGDRRVAAIEGGGAVARQLRERAAAAGWDAREPEALAGDPPEIVVDASVPAPAADIAAAALGTGADGPPLLALCADRSLAESGEPDACGFHVLPPLKSSRLAELTRLPSTSPAAARAAEGFFASLGMHVEWVGDAPGLVLGRIVCQLVNEAAFALGEGVGSADDVDAGLTLGLNHPRGPVEWGGAIGLEHVLATIDGLWEERREERYRAAPLLRRAVVTGEGLRHAMPDRGQALHRRDVTSPHQGVVE
jgi:3-hydroxybutyryl-CoA dehydrogenase